MSNIVDILLHFEYNTIMNNSRLTIARISKGYSQAELAKLTDVSRQTINAIESGDYNPTLKLCIRIAKCLDKKLDELFWEES